MSRKRFKFRKEDEAAVDGSVEKKEQDKEEYDAFGFMKDKKQTAAVAGAFFIVGFLASWFMAPSMTGQVIQSQVPADINKIGNDGVAFLNEYFVEEGQVTLSAVAEEGDLIEVTTSYNGNEIPVYMTKDGKFIIYPDGIIQRRTGKELVGGMPTGGYRNQGIGANHGADPDSAFTDMFLEAIGRVFAINQTGKITNEVTGWP